MATWLHPYLTGTGEYEWKSEEQARLRLKSISFKKIPKNSDLPKIVRTLPPAFM